MLRRTTLARLAVPAAAALAAGIAIPALYANADTTTAAECVKAGNVWIHVAYDETVTGACATKFDSAQAAITETGLSEDIGWIKTVDGRLAEDKEWWSVYTLTPDEHGTYNVEWDFAQVGVAELELKASSVLALQLQADYDLDAVPPAVNPVADVVLGETEPDPTGTPTQQQPVPDPEPSATATTSTESKPAKPTRPMPPKTGR